MMKPEIFLIHGWNMPPVAWEPICRQLADRFIITLATMPGYSSDNSIAPSVDSGQGWAVKNQKDFRSWSRNSSAVPRKKAPHLKSCDSNYDIFDRPCQNPLETVMAALLDQAPATSHWVGWSLGATVAMACAIGHSSRMDRLTLISPTPCFTLRPDWEFGYDQKTFQSLHKITQRRFELGTKNFLSLQTLGDHLEKTFTDVCDHRPTDAALKQGFDILCQSDLRNQIANIKTPTQIIAASADKVVPPPASHWVAQSIPQSTLHTVGAGHGIPITDAQKISKLIANFSTGTTQ